MLSWELKTVFESMRSCAQWWSRAGCCHLEDYAHEVSQGTPDVTGPGAEPATLTFAWLKLDWKGWIKKGKSAGRRGSSL